MAKDPTTGKFNKGKEKGAQRPLKENKKASKPTTQPKKRKK